VINNCTAPQGDANGGCGGLGCGVVFHLDPASGNFDLMPGLTFAFNRNNLKTTSSEGQFPFEKRVSITADRQNSILIHSDFRESM
jgi:hypothetical protein